MQGLIRNWGFSFLSPVYSPSASRHQKKGQREGLTCFLDTLAPGDQAGQVAELGCCNRLRRCPLDTGRSQ